MVLACPACNGRKRDRLATEPFLDKLITRNQSMRLFYYNGSIRNILRGADIRGAEEMRTYRQEGLLNIYSYAQENGYSEKWQPARVAK